MRTWWKQVMLLIATGLLLLFVVSGCDEGTSPLSIDTQTEIEIGQQAATDLERRYGVVTDAAANARVQRIGRRIAAQSQRPDLPWRFRILDVSTVNALALPGGYIYVTRGLLATGLSDAELSGVIAHEVAHVNERHSAEAIERAMQYQLLSELLLGRSSSALQTAADIAVQLALELPNSRANEFEADAVGIRLAYNAGYPAYGMAEFLQRMQQLSGPQRTPEWLSTHPITADRITRAERIAVEVAGQPRPVPVALSEANRKMKQLLIDEEIQEVKDRAAGQEVMKEPGGTGCCGTELLHKHDEEQEQSAAKPEHDAVTAQDAKP